MPAIQPNEVYDTNLRLIFYDEALFGPYRHRFEAIFREPRYTDLSANFADFATRYASILNRGSAIDPAYRDHIAREQRALEILQTKLGS